MLCTCSLRGNFLRLRFKTRSALTVLYYGSNQRLKVNQTLGLCNPLSINWALSYYTNTQQMEPRALRNHVTDYKAFDTSPQHC